MQTANDRLHNQLVSAESDNATLRNDVASLLGAQQELVDSRENMRQLQLDATRRIGQLESDISGLSQQLMVGVGVIAWLSELGICMALWRSTYLNSTATIQGCFGSS